MSWHLYDANGAIKTSLPTVSGSSITGGSIENVPIGQTTPAAGYFSALRLKIGGFFGIFTHANSADRTYTLPDYNATLATIGGTETLTGKTLTSPTINTPVISGGTIDNAPVGTTTRALGYFSALREYIGGFAAIFTHANSADRTYTFPDRTDTIATLGGNESFTGAKDYNGATLRVPVGAGFTPTSTEGYEGWDSTGKQKLIYDGTRSRGYSMLGYQPFAQHASYINVNASGANNTLAANGGTILIPIFLVSHMLLESVTILSNDTATQRTWGWDLYADYNNASNSVNRIATGSANETFTPSAASRRTITVNGGPVYLAPGAYYLAIQNRHASNNFAIGTTTAGNATFAPTAFKTKTTTNPNGSTLDIVAATWTSAGGVPAVQLLGDGGNAAW